MPSQGVQLHVEQLQLQYDDVRLGWYISTSSDHEQQAMSNKHQTFHKHETFHNKTEMWSFLTSIRLKIENN
jgi:hypothetical protein